MPTCCPSGIQYNVVLYYNYKQFYLDFDSGSDSNGGTSWADAVLTVSKVESLVTPPALINVRGSLKGAFVLGKDGMDAGRRLIWRGPASVFSEGTAIALRIQGRKYIKIENMQFVSTTPELPVGTGSGQRNFPADGAIIRDSSYIELFNCTVMGSGDWNKSVIQLNDADYCTITQCNFHIPHLDDDSGIVYSKRGIMIRGSYNYVNGCSIDMNRQFGPSGEGTWDGRSSGISIYAGSNSDATKDVDCIGNVVDNCGIYGYTYYGVGLSTQGPTIKFENNTVRNCRMFPDRKGIAICFASGRHEVGGPVISKNNLFYNIYGVGGQYPVWNQGSDLTVKDSHFIAKFETDQIYNNDTSNTTWDQGSLTVDNNVITNLTNKAYTIGP